MPSDSCAGKQCPLRRNAGTLQLYVRNVACGCVGMPVHTDPMTENGSRSHETCVQEQSEPVIQRVDSYASPSVGREKFAMPSGITLAKPASRYECGLIGQHALCLSHANKAQENALTRQRLGQKPKTAASSSHRCAMQQSTAASLNLPRSSSSCMRCTTPVLNPLQIVAGSMSWRSDQRQ